MNALAPEAQSLAWALLHFLWQGVVIWLLTASTLRFARRRTPQFRYALACVGLLACVVWPLATWLLGRPGGAGLGMAQAIVLVQGDPMALPTRSLPMGLRIKTMLLPFLPHVLLVWICGATFLGLRLAGGWIWLQRLRSKGKALPLKWEQRALELAQGLGLRKTIHTRISDAVEMPMVIGAFRPLILIPTAVLSGLDPWAVECLLVHELAHIRRHDYFVNLLQSVVEVLLFYHPAVWWISRRVRTERELCCDDAAVAHGGDAFRYAQTLNRLDDLRAPQPAPELAPAAGGGNLMQRIQRLVIPTSDLQRSPWAVSLTTLALSGLMAAALMAQDTVKTPPAPPVPAVPSVPALAPLHKSNPKAAQDAKKKVIVIEQKDGDEINPDVLLKTDDLTHLVPPEIPKVISYPHRSVKIQTINDGTVWLEAKNASVVEIRKCLKAAQVLLHAVPTAPSAGSSMRSVHWDLKGDIPSQAINVSFTGIDLKTLQDLPDDAYTIAP